MLIDAFARNFDMYGKYGVVSTRNLNSPDNSKLIPV